MYITNVHIENFRNFTKIDVPLSRFSLVLGINDIGKSNLIEAINLVLYNNKTNMSSKNLSNYDFNYKAVQEYRENIKFKFNDIKNNIGEWKNFIIENSPKIIVELTFNYDETDYYAMELLNGCLCVDENEKYSYKIKFEYYVKKEKEYLDFIYNYIFNSNNASDVDLMNIPTKYFDYALKSSNNQKDLSYNVFKLLKSNIIYANRDSFSSDENLSSTAILSKIISQELSDDEINKLEKDYSDFFIKIQGYDSFKEIFKFVKDNEIKNVEDFVGKLILVPNGKKYQNVLSNISISYDNEMLFQRGLGTRNLIYILTLFSYFNKNNNTGEFNLVSIEEPESHLSVNNYKLILDYLYKIFEKKNKLMQIIITSHSNQFINKLSLANITIICSSSECKHIDNMDEKLKLYLSKRSNFDILNLLFSKNTILVEGVTEELYINSLLNNDATIINDIVVISIGQTGFTTFMDIWLSLHKGDNTYKLGIIKDYDEHENSKQKHLTYQNDNMNIKIAITNNYTFEDDFVKTDNNLTTLNELYEVNYNEIDMIAKLKKDKSQSIYDICKGINNNVQFAIPKHIESVIKWFKNEKD